MRSKPPGFLKVVRILAGLALRRRVNRLAAFTRRKKKKQARGATGRKSAKGGAGLLILFGGLMMLQAFLMSVQVVSRFTAGLEPEDRPATARDMLRERVGPGLGEPWPEDPEHERAVLLALGATLTLLTVAILFTNLGAANQDLGRVRWGTEWLFSFPVTARSLFFAKILEYSVTDLFCWIAVFPFLTVVHARAGSGWFAPLFGAAGALAIAVVISSIRLGAETGLRKRFPLHRLKNVQALCTVLGLLLLFLTFSVALTWPIPGWILSFSRGASPAWLWTPFALPVLLAVVPAAGVVLALGVAAAAFLTVGACSRFVRDGLLSHSGSVLRGKRGRAARPSRLPAFRGILGKEVKLLLRDRNFFVQTLVTPLLIIAFQVLVNRDLFGRGGVTGAIVAYGVGAYVLMFGAFSVLSVERDSMWLLWTFPTTLAGLVRQKARLWATTALVYTGAVLAFSWRPGASISTAEVAAPLMAIAGIALSAFLAAGIGALGTDPFEDRPNRRVSPQWVYLYMLLATLFGFGIWSSSLWVKFVLLVLYSVLVLAIWQKAEERLPLLLDPTRHPPKRVNLADGMLFAIFFFVLRDLFGLLWMAVGVRDGGAVVVLGFAAAGFVTATVALLSLGREGRREVFRFGREKAGRLGRPLLLGAAAGVAGAIVAAGWLLVVSNVEPLREMRDETMRISREFGTPSVGALALLAVVAAPLFEEFLFRGIVFRGLARLTGTATAVVGSALVFAIVHPPLAFPAVFTVGCLAAIVYLRSKTLWSAVACHAVYNGIVVAVSSFAG